MVICKCSQCPYFSNGFCGAAVVALDENGHCSYIWHRGQIRGNLPPADDKKEVEIYDASLVELEKCENMGDE